MVTTITPEMAMALLEKNTKNRNPSKRQIAFLTNEIKEGRFVFNGESIIIAEDGTLLDGQHRLMAVVEANMPIKSVLIRDVPKEAQKTIDVGTCRSASDVMAMDGIKYSTAIAAGIRNIANGCDNKSRKRISTTEIMEMYEKEKELMDAMTEYTIHLYNTSSKVISASQAMAYMYLFSLEDRLAKKFIKEIFTGRQFGKSNAAILLRNRLVDDKLSRNRMIGSLKKELFQTAWKKYLEGEVLYRLRVFTKEELCFVKYGAKSKLHHRDFDREEDD
jgi:hypothetical protein